MWSIKPSITTIIYFADAAIITVVFVTFTIHYSIVRKFVKKFLKFSDCHLTSIISMLSARS